MEITPDAELLDRLSAKLDRALAREPQSAHRAVTASCLIGVVTGMFTERAKIHGSACDGCEFCDFLADGLTVVALHHIHSPALAELEFWKRPS